MLLLVWLLWWSLPLVVGGIRILQFCPGMSGSHILFNFRLAETLNSLGHQVTIYNLVNLTEIVRGSFVPPKGVKEFRFQPDLGRVFGPNDREKVVKYLNQALFEGMSWENMNIINNGFNKMFFESCNQLLEQEEEINKLRGNIDMVLTHPFDYCPMMIAYQLNVSKIGLIMSGTFIPHGSEQVFGLPTLPSYQPDFLALASDRMGFWGRVKNLLWWFLTTFAELNADNPRKREMALFRAQPDQDRPDIWEWMKAHVGLMTINGEANLDFPRPFHHSVMFLGGLSPAKAKRQEASRRGELSGEWEAEMGKGEKGVVLFSLGTVANTTLMPLHMKLRILHAFANMSDFHIIWRIDGGVPGAEAYPHIRIVSWLPQKDLLKHPRLRLFVTHGGYNSLLESAKARVPILLMPLMADQFCNAMRAVRHGFGLYQDRLGFTSQSMEADMRQLIEKEEFAAKAARLGRTLDDKIVSPSALLDHKLKQLMRRGDDYPTLRIPRNQSYFLYFSLDIFAAYAGVLNVLLLFLQRRLLRRSWRKSLGASLLVTLLTPWLYLLVWSSWILHHLDRDEL